MRNPERILTVMQSLMRLWLQYPDWRLGQLVFNIVGRDPFHIEDYDLIKLGYEKFDKDEIKLLEDEWPEYWIIQNEN